jgi:Protein of unknown function (DUF779)
MKAAGADSWSAPVLFFTRRGEDVANGPESSTHGKGGRTDRASQGSAWTADVPPIRRLLRRIDADVFRRRRIPRGSSGRWAKSPGAISISAQTKYWRHTQLIIDVVPGRGAGFTLEAPEGPASALAQAPWTAFQSTGRPAPRSALRRGQRDWHISASRLECGNDDL